MSTTGLPFDDIRALLALLPEPAAACADDARARTPAGLGRLGEIVPFLAGWQGRSRPVVNRPLVALFAGSHGVAPAPAQVTRARLDAFSKGDAVINRICATHGLGLKAFELALEIPTGDISREAAFEEAACAATIAFGMEAIAGADLLCLGEASAGSHVPAAAIFCALFGGAAGGWATRKDGGEIAAIGRALELHGAHLSDPLEVLRRLGGREIAAMAGAIVAARMERVPVVLDGYVAAAAAAVVAALAPGGIDHCLAAHVEPGEAHARVLERLGKRPLLSLGVDAGEGCGAALAAGLVKAAVEAC